MKERTVEVSYMNNNFELSKAVAVMHGNKVNYNEIAEQLNIDANYICEVAITDNFAEYKTSMTLADFLAHAEKCDDNKRKPGYFYRTIKATVYTYKVYDINNKCIVDIQTTKPLKIGKVYESHKVLAQTNIEETETMFCMSDIEWNKYSTIE